MMSTAIKHAVCYTAYRSGLLGLATALLVPLDSAPGDRCFQILTYHRVGNDVDAFVPGISVEGFERQMRCLRDHFRPMSLADILMAADRREIPARAVAVTFDDGYGDVFTHAFPIIRRYEIPVTVYLATGLIDRGRPMWNDRIGLAIRTTDAAVVQPLPDLEPLPLRTSAQRHLAVQRTLEALKRRPPQERDDLTDALVRNLRAAAADGPRMLRWNEVATLHAAGVEFGAHTVDHPILSAIPTDEARREIAESKRTVESRLQVPARHFAYPNGTPRDFTPVIQRLVAEAGFVSAVSTIFGVNTANTDRYALRRGGPWEDDTATFTTKLWWYRWRGNSGESRSDMLS